jgi:hypothetical protein
MTRLHETTMNATSPAATRPSSGEPTTDQLLAGVEPLRGLIGLMPRLRVVLVHGTAADKSWKLFLRESLDLIERRGIVWLSTNHTSRQALRRFWPAAAAACAGDRGLGPVHHSSVHHSFAARRAGPGRPRGARSWPWRGPARRHQVRPVACTRSSGRASRVPAMRGPYGKSPGRVPHSPRAPKI